ncbi:uncharacterized protein MONOS_14759 [Monocercomonoides exilis]|uniref:uncharacterized protein n=1 Tax=Monocercomonoides exilis TaxID=2049356 RepID=UPI00355A7EDD|nr:hypothetical protein MONOS_14759 [Monocercomonoides exilis]|eukprot:MONOS_14759.1-p1 / transcript=MONOS_14759.1 / gene=MONOS_14759 / organism=Monocercomonoides_exilis_PA203 / gene_product=unspecified product / transcript_product=unspecified product / location=Mono_scaffold01065:10089-13591(+) / protein_length=1125 / sequence_SO=supercontig / SO=protein_coding / is_pseudo=false
MGQFTLNIFLDTISGAAHVGKAKNNPGGYNSWFCGLDYYPCATITYTGQTRYSGKDKNIELDSGFELTEEVSMTDVDKEWLISCATKVMNVKVIRPSSIKLADVTSLILANSTSLTLTSCSITNFALIPSGTFFAYSFVKAISGKLNVVQLVIEKTLLFGDHSLVKVESGVNVVHFKDCIINSIDKKSGNVGFLEGAVGEDFGEGPIGIVVIESCVMKNCKCRRKDGKDGKGGGICMSVKGKGSVVVNGTSELDGCEAYKGEDAEGRGGGIMLEMLSSKRKLEIASEVKFLVDTANKAKYGKDVFVSCGSGILLETKIDATTFGFFDSSEMPTDVLKLCGSEDGNGEKVIPLFIYLQSVISKLTVDVNKEGSLNHNYCGFENFGCKSVEYCVNKRVNSSIHEIEVVSESSTSDEIKVETIEVSISGKAATAANGMMRINVKDIGSKTGNYLVNCKLPFSMNNLLFVMFSEINTKRNAFIYSMSTLTITSCSVSFADDGSASEKIAYNILNVDGGTLTFDGFVMEKTVTMNKVSPITISNGVKLEIKNSRVSGLTVEGGSGEGRGCIDAAIKEGGSAVVDNCSISTICTGGSGMKGGGMMISVECGGSLQIQTVTFTGCQVSTEDNFHKGRGIGGGICNAWKGKNMFVSGWNLSEIVNKKHLKWEMDSEELGSLDELCGWERKAKGEEGYMIPLVVYLWNNWSGDGFVSREKGGDFSGCGFSEAPCSSIDHLISLRYEPLEKGETHINIVGSGLLSRSISFSFSSSSISDSPKVVIEGTMKGTGVTISDECENDLGDGSMISSNVSLSFFNVSFTKPSITTHHEVFIESSGTSSLLSVADCSFGSSSGTVESFAYCVIKVNGVSISIQSSTLNKINELKGFIDFSPSASQVTIQNVNISSATLTANSLISMTEEENQMNGNENTHLNGNKPVLKVVFCSLENIKNEGSSASVFELGSFENAIGCSIEDCTMSTCRSDLNTEGGGMKLVLKSEESVLKVNGSTFSTCRCSMESGRGGGLFIDGADPNISYADESQIPSLNFKIVNILFRLNDAFVGKDIFIKCHSIEHQINETLFSLNYNQESLATNNSICGSDLKGNIDMDVIPRITFFKGLQVFLNGSGDDGRR